MSTVSIQSIMLARKGNTIIITIQHKDGSWQEIATRNLPEKDGTFAIIGPTS